MNVTLSTCLCKQGSAETPRFAALLLDMKTIRKMELLLELQTSSVIYLQLIDESQCTSFITGFNTFIYRLATMCIYSSSFSPFPCLFSLVSFIYWFVKLFPWDQEVTGVRFCTRDPIVSSLHQTAQSGELSALGCFFVFFCFWVDILEEELLFDGHSLGSISKFGNCIEV